ncbi:MAG: 16S rRNA (cytosine(1402)-N(4))-methyltransferase RsmH [Bacteroidetes bacterium]|nr:MAG: 16S rRNA (cytosine(1402)-N(4))-methyltransferase RsmH [Bacteroidota bacterium]
MHYHQPVMLTQCVEALQIQSKKIYVDLTFGGGGHSKEILAQNADIQLFGFDQDADAQEESLKIDSTNFLFIKANFRNFRESLQEKGIEKVDGILADLGISSHQIDEGSRGFSTRFDGELDMRMDKTQEFSAKDLINTYSEKDLHKIFGLYGEIKNAKTFAQAVVSQRAKKAFQTTTDLKELANKFAPKRQEFKYQAQLFQAIRIAVNDELKALEEMLLAVPESLNPQGRLVIMSYHSLEDRLVKNIISTGKLHGDAEKDFYGNNLKPLQAIGKMTLATAEEIEKNPRARSAKLRIAEKK